MNRFGKFSPLFTIILGDFNSRATSWWVNDKTAIEGTCLAAFISFHGFQQLISGFTHILPNSMSCIDLIFTDQPNLVVDCGIHPALLGNCHHQIVHCKFNLNIEYPPPYERLVWDYKKSNKENIRKSMEMVDWEAMFANKNFPEQGNIFNSVFF